MRQATIAVLCSGAEDTMLILLPSVLLLASLGTVAAELDLRIGRDAKGNGVLSQLLHHVLDSSLKSHQQLFVISETGDIGVMGCDHLSRTIFSSVQDMERIKHASSRNDFYIVLGSMEWAEEALRALYRIRPQMWWTSKALFVLEALPGVDWIQRAAGLVIPVTVATRVRPDTYAFYAVCLFCNDSRPGMQYIQTWRQGSKDTSKNLFPDLLNDFHGVEFKVSTLPVSYFFYWTPNASMKNWTGFEGEALKAMAHHFHFRVTPSLPKNGGAGSLVNGTWDGHMGMVLGGDAEFAVGKISQTWIRYEYVDFMSFVMIESDSFITQKPKLLSYSSTVYRPFPLFVWILCAISIVAMGITIAIFKRRSFKGLQVGNEIFRVYSLFVVKGVKYLDREERRMRYIIYPGTTRPINTLEDAVERTNLPFYIHLYNDELISNFRQSNISMYKAVASRLKLFYPNTVRITTDNMYMDVLYQLEIEIWKLRKAGDPAWTQLRVADETFLALPSAWPIRKYKPYKPKLDLFILRLRDAGLFNKWMSDSILPLGAYFSLNKVISIAAEVKRISFGMIHVQGIFYALAFGFALAFLAFILELLFPPKL
ncbi:unnamed protein product [Darwinula stevensoni]|uniref:Ionotropic glutamate receptor L-glutamate and glycine-binding domain-containing protein n=1 Tax=Darwinula stevensoni TaxID=69355 RepID=A0A7R9ABX4_9CRUS|nr:unnamed protein product [Darwinula stevensoni]CAG0899820.1 unnamed protein product [Darwinula stevensoni]